MKLSGKDFRVGFWDGATFTPITGEKSSSLAVANEPVDTTVKAVTLWRELQNYGLRTLSVSLNGNVTDSNTLRDLVQRAVSGSIDRYKVISGSGESFDFLGQILKKERSGDFNGAEQFSLSLESTKVPIYLAVQYTAYRVTTYTAVYNCATSAWTVTFLSTACVASLPTLVNTWQYTSGCNAQGTFASALGIGDFDCVLGDCVLTGMLLTYTGFSGPTGAIINRTNPTPPSGSTDSINVPGPYPTSLSWTIPVGGGVVNHPSQTNNIVYYVGINWTGGGITLLQSWRAAVTSIGGGNFSIQIGASPNSHNWAWGYAASCPLGGSVSAGSRAITISNIGFTEAFVTGGTFTLTPIYS